MNANLWNQTKTVMRNLQLFNDSNRKVQKFKISGLSLSQQNRTKRAKQKQKMQIEENDKEPNLVKPNIREN